MGNRAGHLVRLLQSFPIKNKIVYKPILSCTNSLLSVKLFYKSLSMLDNKLPDICCFVISDYYEIDSACQ